MKCKLGVILLAGVMCLMGATPLLAQGDYATLQEYEEATGNKIEKFNEAPMLKALVDAGELPPIEERLPKEPAVIEPWEEIGQYGGTWTQHFYAVKDLGMVYMSSHDRLLRWDREAGEIIPNIAKSWEVSEEGKVYTFHLREGMKWSDGYPFTADDMMFWYEDILLNKELTPGFPIEWTKAGEPVKVEKVDDYTVRFRFAKTNGLFLEFLTFDTFHIPYAPKHYLTQFHPRYTPQEKLEKITKEEGYKFWYQLFTVKSAIKHAIKNPERPVLMPWVLRTETPATRYLFERNPYYWKVDPAGNQLPYIDRIALIEVGDVEMVNTKAMMGEADLAWRRLSYTNYVVFMENREKGNYRVLSWQGNRPSNLALNINQNYSKDDEVLRRILQDVRFRRALSLAIDRDEINEFCFFGRGVTRQVSLVSTALRYSEERAFAYIQYDPERANAFLDEMGLEWDKNHEYRLRPDGNICSLMIEINTEYLSGIDVLSLVKEDWEAIGIKTTIKTTTEDQMYKRAPTGKIQVGAKPIGGGHNPFAEYGFLGYFNPESGFPSLYWCPLNVLWYVTEGKEGEKPTGDILKVVTLVRKGRDTIDPVKRWDIVEEVMDIHIKNLWMIGTVGELPELIIVKNYFRNVPEKSLFNWSLGQYLGLARPEQFFIKK